MQRHGKHWSVKNLYFCKAWCHTALWCSCKIITIHWRFSMWLLNWKQHLVSRIERWWTNKYQFSLPEKCFISMFYASKQLVLTLCKILSWICVIFSNNTLCVYIYIYVSDCMVNVHENSCKDQIAPCAKFRHPKVTFLTNINNVFNILNPRHVDY